MLGEPPCEETGRSPKNANWTNPATKLAKFIVQVLLVRANWTVGQAQMEAGPDLGLTYPHLTLSPANHHIEV